MHCFVTLGGDFKKESPGGHSLETEVAPTVGTGEIMCAIRFSLVSRLPFNVKSSA